MATDSGPDRPVTTSMTAFEIVELLKEERELTLQQLSDELPYAKSTLHRHLATLADEEYVLKTDRGYRLSLRFLDIGIQARGNHDLYSVAKDRVDDLAIETGEKVWCVIEENGMTVPIYGHSGENTVQSNVSVGGHVPHHQMAAGKAILAFLPEARVESIVDRRGLPAVTEHTLTDRESLFRELAEIRERGVAFNREESGPRLHAIGTPILNEDDVAIGAISVSGPARRLQGDLFTEVLPERLQEVASDIEVDLLYA
jgi:DNA-binding IclR family transcriptional regulator